MGVTPLPEASGGGMDANRYNYNGMQSVGLATGYFDNHTTNEHVFLDSFLRTGVEDGIVTALIHLGYLGET